ncbi:hypothetical protein HPL003_21675 [Paenibacillus terrae HPL-003]|uniref:Uncharacterized protein n=1 Tax=Paenibacillus terrae (strain HPL-003) TaxID=985665 RepID=G7VPR5_PAETH|nr:cysteine protease StiP family protein [Paenibacillus terrae]AET61063.1 hypothetical protein HPL003_21675 [Paenibacillus terrae HPL-003]
MNSLLACHVAEPAPMGSYRPEEVTFLLKDLSQYAIEDVYEYTPPKAYMDLFYSTLKEQARKVALTVGIVSELIYARHGERTVLASIRRDGTPIGVLIKRYLQLVHDVDLPHYSFSILRPHVDQNALIYMLQRHPDYHIQFIDSWTGKGATRRVLTDVVKSFNATYGTNLQDDIAVLADIGHCSSTFGTRDDFLIPSALLNAHVNGLISKSVMQEDLIGPGDFHGARYYREWAEDDVSHVFVDTIAAEFAHITEEARRQAEAWIANPQYMKETWQGLHNLQELMRQYGIDDNTFLKPGVGETTRVLLIQSPWKVLVKRPDDPYIRHILHLAAERGVPVEVDPDLTFACCAIIKPEAGV